MSRKKTHTAILCMLLFVAALFQTGCQPAIGWLVAVFTPPKKVEAKYEIPDDKKVLVFVHEPSYRINYDLTHKLNDQLKEHKVADDLIAYEEIARMAASKPGIYRMDTTEVGKLLGADIVIRVNVTKFSLKDDEVSPLWTGRIKSSVKVVSTTEGLLWPKERLKGYRIEEITIGPKESSSKLYGDTLTRELADRMADAVAKLFYDHKVRPQETNQ